MTAGPERIGANGSVGPVAKVHGLLPGFDSQASHGGNTAFRLEECGAQRHVSPGVRIWENRSVWGYLTNEEADELVELLKRRNRKPKGYRVTIGGGIYAVPGRTSNGWDWTSPKPALMTRKKAKALKLLLEDYAETTTNPMEWSKDQIKIVRVY